MKIRTGFVSNSSSMSFIVAKDAFKDVLDFAKHVLVLMIKDDEEQYGKSDEVTQGHRNNLERVQELRSLGVDPNIPYDIPMLEDLCRIFKREDAFYFQTVYAYEGIIRKLPGKRKQVYDLRLDMNFAYVIEQDLVVRFTEDESGKGCTNPRHKRRTEYIELLTGQRYCPTCGLANAGDLHVTKHPEKYKKLNIPLFDEWDE